MRACRSAAADCPVWPSNPPPLQGARPMAWIGHAGPHGAWGAPCTRRMRTSEPTSFPTAAGRNLAAAGWCLRAITPLRRRVTFAQVRPRARGMQDLVPESAANQRQSSFSSGGRRGSVGAPKHIHLAPIHRHAGAGHQRGQSSAGAAFAPVRLWPASPSCRRPRPPPPVVPVSFLDYSLALSHSFHTGLGYGTLRSSR